MAKTKKRISVKTTSEKKESKQNYIQNVFSLLSFLVAVAALVVSIIAIDRTKTQIEMEYNQNLPNLSMVAEWVSDQDNEESILKCQIVNDAGNIREAEIIPHMYLAYICSSDFGGEHESSYAIEIKDFFAPHYMDGLYYSSNIPYDAVQKSWFLNIEQSRIEEALELLFLIGEPFKNKGVMFCLDYCLEVRYLDIMGMQKIEWYNATSEIIYDETGKSSYQVIHIDENSAVPLQVFQNAIGANMGEDLSIDRDEEVIDIASKLCYEGLFGTD